MSRIAGTIGDIWDAVLGRLHFVLGAGERRQVTTKAATTPSSRRFAVVCVYEKTARPDMRALLETLRRAGFYCVLVSTNGATRQYGDLADVAIGIDGYGRDFTAYRAAFRFLAERIPPADSTIAFFNDSVWYFEKYQSEIIDRLVVSTEAGALCAGGFIADEVPHVTGWLFGVPFDAEWRRSLSSLFKPHFLRRARRYHIQFGEHRILPSMTKATSLTVLQDAIHSPAIAACYGALAEGAACFYLKADSQLRTNAASSQLARFLEVNAGPQERIAVLQWLARRSAALAFDWTRSGEFSSYRRRHFGE